MSLSRCLAQCGRAATGANGLCKPCYDRNKVRCPQCGRNDFFPAPGVTRCRRCADDLGCPQCGQSKRPHHPLCNDCYRKSRCKCCWKNDASESGFCDDCLANDPVECADCGVNYTTFHSTNLCISCFRTRQQSDGYACKGNCGRLILSREYCNQCYQARKNYECVQCQVAIAQPGYCARCRALVPPKANV